MYAAQLGERVPNAKVLSGFGSANIVELREETDGSAYRAVYTVRFQEAVYVLHCFQKKSRQGIKTPENEVELIKKRITIAQELHDEWVKREKGQ